MFRRKRLSARKLLIAMLVMCFIFYAGTHMRATLSSLPAKSTKQIWPTQDETDIESLKLTIASLSAALAHHKDELDAIKLENKRLRSSTMSPSPVAGVDQNENSGKEVASASGQGQPMPSPVDNALTFVKRAPQLDIFDRQAVVEKVMGNFCSEDGCFFHRHRYLYVYDMLVGLKDRNPREEELLKKIIESPQMTINYMLQTLARSVEEVALKGSTQDGYMWGARWDLTQVYSMSNAQSTVCETGFNWGASALVWLFFTKDVMVYSFDLMRMVYCDRAAEILQRWFPNRLVIVKGDSNETIPAFQQEHPEILCDLVLVDGGHSATIAAADIEHFGEMASCGARILVDDCGNKGAGKSVREAFNAAVSSGTIHNTGCVTGDYNSPGSLDMCTALFLNGCDIGTDRTMG